MKLCHSCKKELEISGTPGRRDVCPHCGADLKVCLNCLNYDKGAYNQCREPVAERVLEKDKGNFCDSFIFRGSEKGRPVSKADEARKKLEELFKKPD